MDADKDNANPTILDASDLPSRRPIHSAKPRSDGGTGLFDTLFLDQQSQRPTYLTNLLYETTSPSSADEEPIPHLSSSISTSTFSDIDSDSDIDEPIDEQEIYDLIKNISDPEHPLSLGSLSVVNLPDIKITSASSSSPISAVEILITPTITHCSLATVIGLGVRVRLEQALPPRFRVDVKIKQGTHSTAEAVTKQLGDKERVAAALENETLMGVIRKMLSTA